MIKDQEAWDKWVNNNKDSYGKASVDVAREVMKLLDTEEYKEFDTHKIICDANKIIDAGITGFMAGCVSEMVSKCHSRGEEFRKQWNTDNQIGDEGDKANKGGGVLNPALLNISKK